MKKVIIIDDSKSQLYLMQALFEKNDWTVKTFKDAKVAFSEIFTFVPDLIITDAIMPNLGGFQFLKLVRNNEIISKIPVIVYSVLPESNAKFYIEEEMREFFLNKNGNIDELLSLAGKIIVEYPISDSYKENIISSGFTVRNESESLKEEENINEELVLEENEEPDFENETAATFIVEKPNVKELFKKFNFVYDDKKLIEGLLKTLHSLINYDLCVFCLDYCEDDNKKIFFDIKNIILSPIFQSGILKKIGANNPVLFKKYTSKASVITKESDFSSSTEFDFEYNEKVIAKIEFYFNQDVNLNDEEFSLIKECLFEILKTRYVNNKNNLKNKKNESYFSQKINKDIFKKFDLDNEKVYFTLINIKNYKELNSSLNKEDFDIINSKISEKIAGFLDRDEKVYKNFDDEYILIICADNKEKVQLRLNCILSALDSIEVDSLKPEVAIAANSCSIKGNLDIFEAQKNTRKLLELAQDEQTIQIG